MAVGAMFGTIDARVAAIFFLYRSRLRKPRLVRSRFTITLYGTFTSFIDLCVTTSQPFRQLIFIGINIGPAASRNPVDRQFPGHFPTFYRTLVPPEEPANFLPGVQAFAGARIVVRAGHIPKCPVLSLS